MPLPHTAHTSRPWRIHKLTADFRLEDVWALPTPGGPDDFPRLVQLMASGEPLQASSPAARTLWALRWKVGKLLGWNRPRAGLGSRVPTLRDRLPADLRDAPSGPDVGALPFVPLYLIDDEFAAEIANLTMHGVMHLGWVPDQTGGYHGQMAVLVKPNGLLGTAYMAGIKPFRHLVVYPSMIRKIERAWQAPRRADTGERGVRMARVRQIAVPPAARRLSTLSHVDYEDAFLVETGPVRDRTAEQWARAILEDAPITVRSALLSGWSSLGLRLGSTRSDRFVLGWEVRRNTPDVVLLAASSRVGMSAELLITRWQDTLLFATLVQKENPIARAVWAAVEPVHGPVVRHVLEQASRRWRP